MVGRRQQRETRVQLGEALATGGLVVLVVTPIVYRVHTAASHKGEAKGSLFWPTAWMVVPLVVFLVGVALVLSVSTWFARRR